jgi:NADPH:quinone reductase-like Zn-dependent oxidoreductase
MTQFHNPGLMVRQFGAAGDVIALEDCPLPRLSAGQVLVRMRLCAINPSDLITISGVYRSRTALPFVGGFEGVGVIDAVADDVAAKPGGLRPGQRVLPIGSVGTWQTYKVMHDEWCFPLLPALSEEQAATSYINPMTAWLMLTEAATVTMKTRMAISAAGSAIGRMLIRLANARGIRPVATISSAPIGTIVLLLLAAAGRGRGPILRLMPLAGTLARR